MKKVIATMIGIAFMYICVMLTTGCAEGFKVESEEQFNDNRDRIAYVVTNMIQEKNPEAEVSNLEIEYTEPMGYRRNGVSYFAYDGEGNYSAVGWVDFSYMMQHWG